MSINCISSFLESFALYRVFGFAFAKELISFSLQKIHLYLKNQ